MARRLVPVFLARLARLARALVAVAVAAPLGLRPAPVGAAGAAAVAGAPMTTASRTAGVAPLAVFFDAVDTVDEGVAGKPVRVPWPPNWPYAWTSGVVQPKDMEGALFEWDFGDPGAGTWATTGRSKNAATGYTAAHVYETPGTYTARLTVTDTTGAVATYTQQITVREFAGETRYVSASGTQDGLTPSEPQGLADAWRWFNGGKDRRLLLKRGDTFGLERGLSLAPGREGNVLGAYGTGERPVLSFPPGAQLSVSSPDVTLMDVDLAASGNTVAGIEGEAVARQDRLLVLRSRITGFSTAVLTNCYRGTATHLNTGIAIVEVEADCQFVGASAIGMYVGGHQLAVMGCNISRTSSHNLRVHAAAKVAVSNNLLRGGSGNYQHALKLHAPEWERDGSPEARWITISDNVATYPAPWTFSIGPQNAQSIERVSHVVLERNRTAGDPVTRRNSAGLEISARHVMIRNNLLDGTGGASSYAGVLVRRRGIEPEPEDVRILSNTIVRTDAVNEFRGVDADAAARSVVCRNNVASAPLAKTSAFSSRSPGPGFASDHNLLTGAASFRAFWKGDFSLAPRSPAARAGAALAEVRADHVGTPRPRRGPCGVGAFETR